MRRDALIKAMHRAGLRLDDAASAAQIAVQAHRRERDALIVAARNTRLTIRQIGSIFGLSHVQILRVVRRAAQ